MGSKRFENRDTPRYPRDRGDTKRDEDPNERKDAPGDARRRIGHRAPTVAVRGVALILVATAVTGCGWFGGDDFVACPRFVALGDAQQVVRHAPGSARDVRDVLFEGEIIDIAGECETDENFVEIEVATLFSIRRGPADEARRGTLTYFASLVGPDDQVLYRVEETVDFRFRGNRTVAEEDSVLDFDGQLIPGTDPRDYRVVVGIQITREELEFNRRMRR